MAIAVGTIFECNAAATSGNVNGGGFNPGNANGITDGAISNPATATPALSSATYTFVSGDVGAWIYFPTQTNITAGFYQISGVNAGAATLAAAAGEGELISVNLVTNTAADGVGTATTGVTFLVDYSRGTSAVLALSDFASVNNSSILTSATGGFTRTMVGNLFQLASGTNALAGWYEISNYTNANTVTIDRDCAGAGDLASGVGKVGGAMSLGSTLDDDLFSILSNTSNQLYFFVKAGTYTIGEAVTTGDGVSVEGYKTKRGDRPLAATDMPVFDCGASNSYTHGRGIIRNISITGSAAIVAAGTATAPGSTYIECVIENTSTTANRAALYKPGRAFGCRASSFRGIAYSSDNSDIFSGCHAHDSAVGFSGTAPKTTIENCLSTCNYTSGIAVSTTGCLVSGNTVYGNGSGIGIGISTNNYGHVIKNNLLIALATGANLSNGALSTLSSLEENTFFGNGTDIAGFINDPSNSFDDPGISSGYSYRTGTTATTTAGDHIVQTGATFQTWGVQAGDYVYVSAGTGVTAMNYRIVSVDSETQITVVPPIAANATADKTWHITTGRNFSPSNIDMKGNASPTMFRESSTQRNATRGASQFVAPNFPVIGSTFISGE